jgi:hypothetical protein
MLHAGLDFSRKRVDVCLVCEQGAHLDQLVTPPDGDALRGLARRVEKTYREPVCAVVESMSGARFVHDTLEAGGLGGRDRRRSEGQGSRSAGLQDRQDRLPGLGDAEPAGPGAGDLAARPAGAGGARAGPLSVALGQAQVRTQMPDPLDADHFGKPCRSLISSGSKAGGCSSVCGCPSPGVATSPRASS